MTEQKQRIDIITDRNSIVNQYKILTLEEGSHDLTERKITLVFQVLDELIPQLGVYSPVFRQIREDIFDAVYSDIVTSVSGQAPGYLGKVPYFTMVKTVFDTRDEVAEELTTQLETVKERLFNKHKQYEESQVQILELNKQIEQLKSDLEQREEDIKANLSSIQQLEQNIEENGEQSEHVQHQMQCDIDDLQEEVDENASRIIFLERYKKGYDDLEEAFQDKIDNDDGKKKSPVLSSQKENLLSDLQSAHKLEEQILVVLNATIEEYDHYLEEHKAQLVESGNHGDMDDYEAHQKEMELSDSDQQLQMVQDRFCKTVKDMSTEHEMIRLHMTMLQEQLQIIDASKPQTSEARTVGTADSKTPATPSSHTRPHKEDSILSAGLKQDKEKDPTTDPFIPQERIFSKYASMLYTSTNAGKTFYELKDAKFCPSCGEKEQSMQPLLAELRDHMTIDRVIPRTLSLERTLSFMEQFYVFLVQQDDGMINQGLYQSITENLLSFSKARYLIDEVAYLSCHDFLASLTKHTSADRSVEVFSHVVVGNLDASCLRYLLLMADFIELVTWKHVNDFRSFAAIVYPFLTEDDLDSLLMSYTSFSENVINKHVVIQFFMHTILKYREPRFLDCENKLMGLQNFDNGLIEVSEYSEIMDQLVPLSRDQLKNRLYMEAVENAKNSGIADAVPIAATAQIVSYLSLLQIASLVRETVVARITESRVSSPHSYGTNETAKVTATTPEPHMVTLGGVRNLATTLAKQMEERQERVRYDSY